MAAALCMLAYNCVPADNQNWEDFVTQQTPAHQLLHRDIKLGNFFLDAAPSDAVRYPGIPVIKCGDFGNA
jgi:serine/threonine protein kinase